MLKVIEFFSEIVLKVTEFLLVSKTPAGKFALVLFFLVFEVQGASSIGN